MMRQRIHEIVAGFGSAAPPLDRKRGRGGQRIPRVGRWRELHLPRLPRVRPRPGGRRGLLLRPLSNGSGVGVLRHGSPVSSASFARLPADVRAMARARPLILTKANSRSTVHRPLYLDYIGVKRFEAGEVVGSVVSSACTPPPPRRRARAASRSCATRSNASCAGRRSALRAMTRRRWQGARELPTGRALPDHGRRSVRDLDGNRRARRAPACASVRAERPLPTVCVVSGLRTPGSLQHRQPRADRLGPQRRVRRDRNRLGVAPIRLDARASPLHRALPRRRADHDVAEIERRIAEVTRPWTGELADALREAHGEEHGNALFRRYRAAFPIAYRADWRASAAVEDIDRAEALAAGDGLIISVYETVEDDRTSFDASC